MFRGSPADPGCYAICWGWGVWVGLWVGLLGWGFGWTEILVDEVLPRDSARKLS